MNSALLTLRFTDGTEKKIQVIHAIEIDTPGKQELSFRETPKGWVMAFTKSVKDGRMFDRDFLTCVKHDSPNTQPTKI